MRAFSMFALTLGAFTALTLGACVVGDEGPGQDESDLSFCRPAQVDTNADGVADGLDVNCDGAVDILYGGGSGSGSGTRNSCSTMITLNGETRGITCNGDGTSASCECRVNGSLVQTCTQPTASCSIGAPTANCCGF